MRIFMFRYIRYPSDIKKIPSVRLRTSSHSIHGLTLRNVPVRGFHEINRSNRSALTSTCNISVSTSRRLADKRFDSKSTNLEHKNIASNGTESRFNTKSKEVRFDTSTEIHLYRYGISDSTECSHGTSRPSRTSYSDYQNIFISDSKKVREKSRECHNHKPQPFPDPKRKRKPTNLNKHKPNKRTKSTKISSLFPKQGNFKFRHELSFLFWANPVQQRTSFY